jgi:hypothetical protein
VPDRIAIITRLDFTGAANIDNKFVRLIDAIKGVRRLSNLNQDQSDNPPGSVLRGVAQIDLAQHPRDVLDELARGEGDAAERVFDRSFNPPQLGDDGRATLLALSLFVPSTSRSALADVAGFGGDAKRLKEAVGRLAASGRGRRSQAALR